MADYMTTKEVAAHLRLNEKKIYAMATRGEIPAARVSGKWLFPRATVDAWIQRSTHIPTDRLLDSLLETTFVLQGSDDQVLDQALARYSAREAIQVLTARVGSVAGLRALSTGRAHLAGCHLPGGAVREAVGGEGCYLLSLFRRSQGLIHDASRTPGLRGLGDAVRRGLGIAGRQVDSGTWKLTLRLSKEDGVSLEDLRVVETFSSHVEVALAVAGGRADVGVGSLLAATLGGLDFVPLAEEEFQLAVPSALASHPRMVRLLEVVQDELQESARAGVPGYSFSPLGHLETLSPASG